MAKREGRGVVTFFYLSQQTPQFTAAWLIWIDGAVSGNKFSDWKEPPWYFYLPGFISTAVLVMYASLLSVSARLCSC